MSPLKPGTPADEELRRHRRRIADARLYKARTQFGQVPFQLWPFVGISPLVLVRGQQITMNLPEVVDAWEFLSDLNTFARGWRPMRLRTDPQRVATREWFAQWERLGAVVEPERWGVDEVQVQGRDAKGWYLPMVRSFGRR